MYHVISGLRSRQHQIMEVSIAYPMGFMSKVPIFTIKYFLQQNFVN